MAAARVSLWPVRVCSRTCARYAHATDWHADLTLVPTGAESQVEEKYTLFAFRSYLLVIITTGVVHNLHVFDVANKLYVFGPTPTAEVVGVHNEWGSVYMLTRDRKVRNRVCVGEVAVDADVHVAA
jgi:hypothetical protein